MKREFARIAIFLIGAILLISVALYLMLSFSASVRLVPDVFSIFAVGCLTLLAGLSAAYFSIQMKKLHSTIPRALPFILWAVFSQYYLIIKPMLYGLSHSTGGIINFFLLSLATLSVLNIIVHFVLKRRLRIP